MPYPPFAFKLSFSVRRTVGAVRRAVLPALRVLLRVCESMRLLRKLVQSDEYTPNLFVEPPRRNDAKLMETIDLLNQRFGRGAVRVGTVWPSGRAWEMKREMLSPAYTSSWRELPRAG